MPLPDDLPLWPQHTAGRLSEVERFIATERRPPTAADISAAFAGTIPHELQETLQLLLALGRTSLIGDRYYWAG